MHPVLDVGEEAAMFEIFAGERRAHPLWRRRDTLLLSLGAHALLLLGAAYVPVRTWTAATTSPLDATVAFLDLLPALETPASPMGEAGVSSASDPTPGEAADEPAPLRPLATGRAAAEIAPPREIPAGLPDVLPDEGAAGSFLPAATGAQLQVASGGEGVQRAMAWRRADEPVDVGLVAELPVLRNPREMQGVWERLYPFSLLARRIEGEAVVRFIIGTDGRVDPGTILLLRTTHPRFGEATLRGVRKLRFRPARIGERPVRVRAELPIYWKLADGA